MKFLHPFRLAAVLLVIFCAGHTAGGMLAQKSLGPEADRVFEQMKAVHFDFNGADSTWYGFWFAFGLTVSVFLLLSAIASWRFARLEPKHWHVVAPIAWTLVASHAANAVLSWRYFFPGAATIATLVTLLLAFGSWRAGRAAHAS
jgi:hypothetical protein